MIILKLFNQLLNLYKSVNVTRVVFEMYKVYLVKT